MAKRLKDTSITAGKADSKGRVSLGSGFAGRDLLIRRVSPTQIQIELARVVPEREAWLYENPEALQRIRRGLQEARAGEFAANPPNLDSDTGPV